MPVSPILNIACIFWSHTTEGHNWIRQDTKRSMRGISRQGPAKADWDYPGQQKDDKTLISTRRYQNNLAPAYSKQKVVGFDTVKPWNVLSWCNINYTVSWLQCLRPAWQLNSLHFCSVSLLWNPLLLGQVSYQADPGLDLTVSFTEIWHISSSCEQTAFLPASGLINLIMVAPGSNWRET